jgi:hypothetical protein
MRRKTVGIDALDEGNRGTTGIENDLTKSLEEMSAFIAHLTTVRELCAPGVILRNFHGGDLHLLLLARIGKEGGGFHRQLLRCWSGRRT